MAAWSGEETAEAEAAAEAVARQQQAEALKVKVAHYSSEVASLQMRLVRQESAEAVATKLDAVPSLKEAKALLKAAFPQLVSLQLGVQKKEQQLETRLKEVMASDGV